MMLTCKSFLPFKCMSFSHVDLSSIYFLVMLAFLGLLVIFTFQMYNTSFIYVGFKKVDLLVIVSFHDQPFNGARKLYYFKCSVLSLKGLLPHSSNTFQVSNVIHIHTYLARYIRVI
jgi:hypothetical protein